MVSITFLTALLQGQKLSIYQCFRNLTQVDLKHSKSSCQLVLLQPNINNTWILDWWYVLHFELLYSRDKNCPSTQNLGWNLGRWHVLHFSLSYFRYWSCPSTLILGAWSKLIWNTANEIVSLCYCKQTSTAPETWINGVYYISHCPTSGIQAVHLPRF